MRHDKDALMAQVDLAVLVEKDLGPALKHRGRWWWWRCPFHKEKTPSFGVTPATGRFKCFGCGAEGDHIDWLREYRKLSWRDALQELARLAALPDMPRPRLAGDVAGDVYEQPSDKWQATARAFCEWARPLLWEPVGAPGLAYLRAGGLQDETIRRFGLGWCPEKWLKQDPERWGLKREAFKNGVMWLYCRGVTIPAEVAGTAWYVKVRLFDSVGRPEPADKYRAIPHDPKADGGALFGADDLRADGRPLLLAEGERDAMLAWQELQDLVDVATLGGAGKRQLGRWRLWLQPYKRILGALDTDKAGQTGAEALQKELGKRFERVKVPHEKDLTDFHAAGGDLRAWLAGIL